MPYLAQLENGKIIRADNIKSKNEHKDFVCPYCGDVLGYRKEAIRDDGSIKSRAHFWHYERAKSDNAGGCSSINESEEHKLMKKHIVEKFENINDDVFSGNVHLEKKVGENIADVVYEFDNPITKGEHQSAAFRDETHPIKQNGIIFEVQYKNESKNYLDVTKNALKNGYAIQWIFHSDSTKEITKIKNQLNEYLTENIDFAIYKDGSTSWGDTIYYNNFKYVIKSIDEFYPLNPNSDYQTEHGAWNLGTFKSKCNLSKTYIHGYMFLEELFTSEDVDYIYFSDRKGGCILERDEINNIAKSSNDEIIRLSPLDKQPALNK